MAQPCWMMYVMARTISALPKTQFIRTQLFWGKNLPYTIYIYLPSDTLDPPCRWWPHQCRAIATVANWPEHFRWYAFGTVHALRSWCSNRFSSWSHSSNVSSRYERSLCPIPFRSEPPKCQTHWCHFRWPTSKWLRLVLRWRWARRRATCQGQRLKCAGHFCPDSCTGAQASASSHA